MSKEDKFLETLRSFMEHVTLAGNVSGKVVRGELDTLSGLQQVTQLKRECRKQKSVLAERMYKAYKGQAAFGDAQELMRKAYEAVNQMKYLLQLLDTVQVGEAPQELKSLAELVEVASVEMKKIMDYTRDVKSNAMKIEARCQRIYSYEERGDACVKECLQYLYGQNTNPMYLLYWKDVLLALEEILDRLAGMVQPLQGVL